MSVWLPIDPMKLGAGTAAVGARDPNVIPVPAGCAHPPTTSAELTKLSQDITFLSRSAAVSLGLTVANLTTSGEQRVWVSEQTRHADCAGAGGAQFRYGTSVRLIVHFSVVQASSKLTLPVIAAEAQLGNVEARVSLSIVGFKGNLPSETQIPWQPFNVETYGVIMERAAKARDYVFAEANAASIAPVLIAVPSPTGDLDGEIFSSLGRTWAVGAIADGRSCTWARGHLPENLRGVAAASDEVRVTYEQMTRGGQCDDQEPDPAAQATASGYLRSLRLRSGWL